MATAFHPFSLLPLELRQHIWELSMTPRRVPLGDFSCQRVLPHPPSAPPPAVLQACTESRLYLVRYHSKIFVGESRYIWVNYELDTICINEWAVEDLLAELPPIKHLSVDITDEEHFWHEVLGLVRWMPSLENFEIKPAEKGRYWWIGWDHVMQNLYDPDDPVRFRTTILSPVPNHEVPALTPDNHVKVERDFRRRDMAENPERYRGEEMSDSEDDVCRPG